MIKPNQGICSLSGRINCFILFLLLFTSCSANKQAENNEFAKFSAFFASHNFSAFTDQTSSILVLEEAGCITCSKSYALLIKRYINDEKAVIVISASGALIDISAFLGDTVKNIFWDDKQEFKKISALKLSSAIFLKNKNIDTIVTIDVNDLEEKLQYINKRLSEK